MTVEATVFARLDATQRAELEATVARFGEFLGLEAKLELEQVERRPRGQVVGGARTVTIDSCSPSSSPSPASTRCASPGPRGRCGGADPYRAPEWWPFDLPTWRGLLRAGPVGAVEAVFFAARYAVSLPEGSVADALETVLGVVIALTVALMVVVALYNRPAWAVRPALRGFPGAIDEWQGRAEPPLAHRELGLERIRPAQLARRLAHPQHLRRHPADDGVRGHVPGDDRARADHGVVAHPHAAQEAGPVADPDVAPTSTSRM